MAIKAELAEVISMMDLAMKMGKLTEDEVVDFESRFLDLARQAGGGLILATLMTDDDKVILEKFYGLALEVME